MKNIIVIAGHRDQFEHFVKATLALNRHVRGRPGNIIVDGMIFQYVTSGTALRGMTLSEDAELVKVGTWYELPAEDIEGIEVQFKARKSFHKSISNCKTCGAKDVACDFAVGMCNHCYVEQVNKK